MVLSWSSAFPTVASLAAHYSVQRNTSAPRFWRIAKGLKDQNTLLTDRVLQIGYLTSFDRETRSVRDGAYVVAHAWTQVKFFWKGCQLFSCFQLFSVILWWSPLTNPKKNEKKIFRFAHWHTGDSPLSQLINSWPNSRISRMGFHQALPLVSSWNWHWLGYHPSHHCPQKKKLST